MLFSTKLNETFQEWPNVDLYLFNEFTYLWSMRFIKHSILLLLLFFLFVGNVGVNVFKHICSENGVVVSYVFNEGENQCKMHEIKQDLSSCCHENESKDEKGCCSDEVEYVKLKTDVEQHHPEIFSFPLQAVLLPSVELEEISQWYDEYISTYKTPPPPNSRELLIRKQVWII